MQGHPILRTIGGKQAKLERKRPTVLASIFPRNFCCSAFDWRRVHPRCTTHYYWRSSEHECAKGIVGGNEAPVCIGLTNAKRQGCECAVYFSILARVSCVVGLLGGEADGGGVEGCGRNGFTHCRAIVTVGKLERLVEGVQGN